MRETKLFRHLSTLTEQQRKSFLRFLASPYFNTQPRLGQLFEALDSHLLPYKLRQLSEEEAWALYNPALPYDQNKFRKECSALLRLFTEFLVTESASEDKPRRSLHLLRRLNGLGLHQDFPGHAANAHAQLQEAREGDMPDYDVEVLVGLEENRHDIAMPGRGSEVSLAGLILASERAHCIRKMELLYLALNLQLVRGAGAVTEEPEFLQLVERHLPALPALTRMHFHLYHCSRRPTEETHYQAFHIILQSAPLAPADRAQMYSAALNYCSRRLNAGATEFLREIHRLHREMLDLGLLDVVDFQISAHFKNAVVCAARLGELDWAEALLRRLSPALAMPEHQTAKHFATGIIAYHAGDLSRSETAFHKVLQDFDDLFYGLDARSYLLRIFWETQNLIGLESMLDSYRMFLKRTREIAVARKAIHNQFIRLMRKLVHTRRHDHDAIRRLLVEVRACPQIAPMQWLAAQVQAMLP